MSEPKRRRKKLSTVRIAGEEFNIHAPGFKAILRKGQDIARPYWVADEDAVNSGYRNARTPRGKSTVKHKLPSRPIQLD
jgi:hypothetical protein